MMMMVMMMMMMIITDTHDCAGVLILHRYNELGSDQHLFLATCRRAVRLCTQLIPIRLCMMEGDASRRQQVTPHLPLSL